MSALTIIGLLIKFIAGCVGLFTGCLFVLSVVNSIINPTFPKEGETNNELEKYDNFRMISAIVMSVCFGLIIIL